MNHDELDKLLSDERLAGKVAGALAKFDGLLAGEAPRRDADEAPTQDAVATPGGNASLPTPNSKIATAEDLIGEELNQESEGDEAGWNAELDQPLSELYGFVALMEHAWPRGDVEREGNEDNGNEDGSYERGDSDHELGDKLIGETIGEDGSRMLGRFRLVKKLGKGGYGIVFLAEDLNTQRFVALKVPRPDVLITPELKRRFVREARAAAALNHPSIVGVYEAHEVGPTCYIASVYSPGTDLAAWLASREEPVSPGVAASIVAILADAVEHAHSRGVLHRDIKPSNVLLEERTSPNTSSSDTSSLNLHPSTFLPKLCDFGLAKLGRADGKESHLTRSGQMLGTPSYMSPEQVSGRGGVVTEAVDIYALGAILYELLTGQAPFIGESTLDIIRQVTDSAPVDPRGLRNDIPRDLVAICFKCLEKRPTERYASAGELADDLRRFLAGQTVEAKLPGLGQRMFGWVQRNPRLSIASALAVSLFIVSLFAIQSGNSRRQEAMNVDLEQSNTRLAEVNASLSATNKTLAETQNDLREHLYIADMANASTAFAEHDWTTVRKLLNSHVPKDDEIDLRRTEWYLLNGLTAQQHGTVLGKHDGPARAVSVAKDGKRAYSVGHDGRVLGFDLATGQQISDWQVGTNGIQLDAIALSDDGRHLVTGLMRFGDAYGKVVVLDLQSGEEVCRVKAHSSTITGAAFSPDGQLFATGQKSRYAKGIVIHNLDGELVRTIDTTAETNSISFSPDGRSLFSKYFPENGTTDRWIRAWPLDEQEDARDYYAVHAVGWLTVFALTSDASHVAFFDANACAVYLQQSQELGGNVLAKLPCNGDIDCLDLSSDGSLLTVGSSNGDIRVWNLESMLQSESLQPATGSGEPPQWWPQVFNKDTAQITSVRFVPGSKPTELITTSSSGEVIRWTLEARNPRPFKPQIIDPIAQSEGSAGTSTESEIQWVDFVPDPRASDQYYVLLLDGRLGRLNLNETEIVHGPEEPMEARRVSEEDRRNSLLTRRASNKMLVHRICVGGETFDGTLTVLARAPSDRSHLAVGDTEPLIAATLNDHVHVFSTTGELLCSRSAPSFRLNSKTIYHDILLHHGTLITLGGRGLGLFDLASDSPEPASQFSIPSTKHGNLMEMVAIPQSSSVLVVSSRALHVLDDDQLTEITTSLAPTDGNTAARFSGDGKLLALGKESGHVELLDGSRDWMAVARFRACPHRVGDCHFMDNDRTLVTTHRTIGDSEISFWDIATQKLLTKVRVPIEFEKLFPIHEGCGFITYAGRSAAHIWTFEK